MNSLYEKFLEFLATLVPAQLLDYHYDPEEVKEEKLEVISSVPSKGYVECFNPKTERRVHLYYNDFIPVGEKWKWI